MDEDTELAAHFNMLQEQKQLLKKAKSRKGQRPTQAMLRSRAELEQVFLTGVISFSVNITLHFLMLTRCLSNRLSKPKSTL